jgi:hypothetical protein
VDGGAAWVGGDTVVARDAIAAGVSGRLDSGCGDGADGGDSTAGRDEQAVSKKRAAIASQFCKTLAFRAIWVYNLS